MAQNPEIALTAYAGGDGEETTSFSVSFNALRGDKIVLLSKDQCAMTTFFEITSNAEPAEGTYEWGKPSPPLPSPPQ